MTSLRRRLFLQIAAVTVLIWAAAAAWTTLSTKARIEHVLDQRLREAAHMVASLSATAASNGAPGPAMPLSEGAGYNRQLSCQIWTLIYLD